MLSRPGADTKACRDHLVRMTFHKEREHFQLAWRQSIQNPFRLSPLGMQFLEFALVVNSIIDGLKKFVGVKRLLDKMHGAGAHGLNGHGHVRLTRHENERRLDLPVGQSLLKRKAIHARQENID